MTRKLFRRAILVASASCAAAAAYAAQPHWKVVSPGAPNSLHAVSLQVEPPSLTLENARDARRVLISVRMSDGSQKDVTDSAIIKPQAPLVQVDADGYFNPAAPGATRVEVAASGLKTSFPITVRSMASPPISFVRDVMPVLSKSGCNAGTCHGSAKGKNGFKLSLRGYDPDFDFKALIDDISGRRFNRVYPEQSLMLRKPIEEVPHQGGLVIEPGSRFYQVLYRWIAEGVHSDATEVQRVNRLEVLPAQLKMGLPGEHQQILVIAHYPDGSTRDVTRDAVFTSSVPDVATVSASGRVDSVRRGEAAILVRYEGNYGVDNLLVMGDRRGFEWKEPPAYNYIDTLVYQKLKKIKVLPSGLCTDSEFLRRVSLDLVGQAPSPTVMRAYLADTTPSKERREKVIDRLLQSPEYTDNWANKWADLLQCNQKFLGAKGVVNYYNWIHESIAQNKPYDQFVRDLLMSAGSSFENPASNFYRVSRDPSAATENVTQLFLGTRFSCNKCHDHPFERWTQRQYYQFGSFFARVGYKPGPDPKANPDEEIISCKADGDFIYPKDNKPADPVFPFGPVPEKMTSDRRAMMAEWLTSPKNPLFAKSMANRVWSYFFGKGIIDPVDDIRSGNPPSNPALVEALTKDFISSGFDVKHLMRTICMSRVYQLSLKTNKFNADDPINFSHALPRRLTAEQLFDSIERATGSQLKAAGMPAGGRATQIPDTKIGDGGNFLALFGSPPRESVCECERTSQVSLGQALNLVNGPTISDAIIDPKGRIATAIAANIPDDKLTEDIFLATICRMPTPKEVAASVDYIQHANSKIEGAQDLMWGLITSPAFLFNH